MSGLLNGKVFVKISELPPTTDFSSADEFALVHNDITVKITGQSITDSVTAIGNLASKGYVDTLVDGILGGAPGTLDTLNELALALNDDANFASTITGLINSKLNSTDFGLRFWDELISVNTYHITEGSNLYWTQERFDTALASKNTFHVAEGSNLYFTEQRVRDILDSMPPPPPADRLISGEVEVVLQSNGYIRLANGAQLYDYGSGTGSGYGITDAANSTYIGYDPDDTLGALHMDSYTGGNIRIRTTTLPNTYNDWLFDSTGVLSIPVGGDIKRNGVSVLGGGSDLTGYATQSYVTTAILNLIGGAPGALDTLQEIAQAIGNDFSFYGDVFYAINQKIAKTSIDDVTLKFNGDGKLYVAGGGSSFSGDYNDLTNKPTIPSAYTLPTATTSVLGGVKVGAGLSITNGVLSVTATSTNGSFTSLSTTDLTVQNVTFSGAGAVALNSNNDLNINAVGTINLGSITALPGKTRTQLAAITSVPAGSIAYCSNATGGACPVWFNGTSWLKLSDNGVI